VISWLADLQRGFQEGMSSALHASADPNGGWALLLLLGFSFLLGLFHTLLPGHQKAIIGAYFASENARYSQGFVVGVLFAALHAGLAITILSVVYFVLQFSAGQSYREISAWTQTVSAWGIIAFGVVLFATKMAKLGEVHRLAELERVRRRLGFDLHDRLEASFEPIPWRRLLPFLMLAALAPCPFSILVLFLALNLGVFALGVAAVVAISVGMAFTLTGISLGVIALKRQGRRLGTRAPGRAAVFLLEALSLVVLVAFALLLLPAAGARV